MGLSTDVIRFLTIRVDEHEDGPSAMMRRSDRDERDGRRGPRRDRDHDRDRDRPPRGETSREAPREASPEPARAPKADSEDASK